MNCLVVGCAQPQTLKLFFCNDVYAKIVRAISVRRSNINTHKTVSRRLYYTHALKPEKSCFPKICHQHGFARRSVRHE